MEMTPHLHSMLLGCKTELEKEIKQKEKRIASARQEIANDTSRLEYLQESLLNLANILEEG